MLYMEGFPPSAALHVAIMEFNSSLLSTSKWSQKPFTILEYMWVADAHAGVAALSDRWCSTGATVTLQSASKVPKLARVAFAISQFPFGFPKIWDLTRGGIDLAHEVFCLSCHFQFVESVPWTHSSFVESRTFGCAEMSGNTLPSHAHLACQCFHAAFHSFRGGPSRP